MTLVIVTDDFFCCADCNTEDGSVGVETELCGEGQPDFRSILSYGVQEL